MSLIKKKMEQQQPQQLSVRQYAMRFGIILGLFWIIKFTLLPMGLTNPFLELLFIVLTILVPYITWRFTRMYRDNVYKGSISFLKAWQFCLLTYFFASLLTALAHFIYFQYIDNGYIVNTYRETLQSFSAVPEMSGLVSQMNLALDAMSQISARDMVLQLFIQNIFCGNIIAIITALFVSINSKTIS